MTGPPPFKPPPPPPPLRSEGVGPSVAAEHEGHALLVSIVGDDPDYFLAEMESLIGELHDARLALANHRAQMARNESEFGTIGNLPSIWDNRRKVLLNTQIEWKRMQMEALNEIAEKTEGGKVQKITEQYLDSWAHQSDEYVAFVNEATRARAQYELDRAEHDKLWAQVHMIEGKKAYLESRLRMIEEKMRFHRAIAQLGKG